MGEAADNPGFWSRLLGGVVGFFTGGVGGAIAGAVTDPFAPPPPPPPPAPVTGITGMGTAQPALPTMTGSGLGTLTPGAMPGVAEASLFGAPEGEPERLPLAERLLRIRELINPPLGVVRLPLAERLAALRDLLGPPIAGVPAAALAAAAPAPVAPVVPAPVPWWQQLAGAVGGFIQGRQAAAIPRVESIFDEPGVSPSGVVSIF